MAGWGAGPEAVDNIALPGWDVAVAYDFTDLSLDDSFLERYYTVYVFAWSLGVAASSLISRKEAITAAFAINGTLSPADDSDGIPIEIFNGTLAGLDERNLYKFRLRMAGDRRKATELHEAASRDVGNLRQQLATMMDLQASGRIAEAERLPWVRAFISRDDRIFPPENQRNSWKKAVDVEIVELNGAHLPSFSSVVRMVIADTRMVSRRFSQASGSYDRHAIAQYSAAMRLAAMLDGANAKAHPSVLEIGCGTGLFSKEYGRLLSPREVTFVDITGTGPFGISEREEYVVEDAERWIERQAREWDCIVSASAIQWFADIPRFLRLCSERLTPGGLLAISTFLPGNMEELDAVRPSPLRYPTEAQLREWLGPYFDDILIESEAIRIEFRSVREMLMHLKYTGVAGSAQSSPLSIGDMAHVRALTYRPVYILARNPQSIITI